MKIVFLLIFAAVLSLVSLSWAPAAFAADAESAAPSIQFDDFKTHVEGTHFNVSLPFKGDFASADLTAAYVGDSLQIDIPGANFPKGKHLLRTNGKVVKSVYVSQPDENTVRLRVTLNKGFRASALNDSLKITRVDGAFNLNFDAGIEKTSATENEKTSQALAFDDAASVSPIAKDAVKDDIIEQARLVARDADAGHASRAKASDSSENQPLDATAAVTGATTASATATTTTSAASAAGATDDVKTADMKTVAGAEPKKSENEIPLVVEKDTKKSESAPWQRIVLTLGVMTTLGVGASFGMKKWSQSARNRVTKNARIKVLTQHHLGPKKSLMIVEVAGESMLIGVTDHAISMIKSLSLIDDEIPEALPASFEGAMDQNFIETANTARPRISAATKEDARAQRALASAQSEADDEGENFALHGLSEIRDKVSTRLKNMRPL